MRQLNITSRKSATQIVVKKPRAKKQNISKFSLMQHIEQIVTITNDSKFSDEAVKQCEQHAKIMAEKLSLSSMQCLLLAVLVDQSDDERIRIADIARHFGCKNTTIMCYSCEFDILAEKSYIRKGKCVNRLSFKVPEDVVEALKKNTPYTAPSISNLTIRKFFDFLDLYFEERGSEEMTTEELSTKIKNIISINQHLGIVKALNKSDLEDNDEYSILLLLFFCHKLINEDDDNIYSWNLESLFDSRSEFSCVKNALKRGYHDLIQREFVESKKDGELANRDCYCLTDAAKTDLLSELEIKVERRTTPKDIIKTDTITAKSLFYNKKEYSQITQLTSLLQAENFINVQKRLSDSGMRKGFACLFYGSPGTGKTETVYQVARQTGRDILVVNVSEIKSMWVGESEKNIKALFDRYRNLAKNSTNTPILLFNEADAVLGVRQEGAERAVDKMENSIQNIILQEMENLDGIMIATTNLTQNLDKAFERRFLYKIEFEKPSIEAKQAIWRSMIPVLPDDTTIKLANAYNFSGGQIENIARKCTVETIINGNEPTIADLHAFCESEMITKTQERRRIGF